MMTDNSQITLKYRLTGDVQGVGFRYFLREAARRRQVTGFAKNEPDGSLIVFFTGDKTQVDEMVTLMREGPPGGRVVSATELLADRSDTAFEPLAIL